MIILIVCAVTAVVTAVVVGILQPAAEHWSARRDATR